MMLHEALAHNATSLFRVQYHLFYHVPTAHSQLWQVSDNISKVPYMYNIRSLFSGLKERGY